MAHAFRYLILFCALAFLAGARFASLLAHPRYGRAANFFLNELYGPQDYGAIGRKSA